MRAFLKAGVAASLIFSSLSPALAQDSAPRSLAPRALSPSELKPVPKLTPIPVETISEGIKVQTLGQVSSEASGALSGQNALPSTMWEGASRPLVEAMLTSLAPSSNLPQINFLQRRLLLSSAQPPKGQEGSRSLTAIRAQKLAEMGRPKDVLALINSAPQNERNEDLLILLSEALLLSGDISDACALSSSQVAQSQTPYWIKSLAFCQMLAKQGDKAMLSLSLLKDMGDDDPLYYSLMESMNAGEKPTIKTLATPNGLHLSLLSASKAKLPKVDFTQASPKQLAYFSHRQELEASLKAYNLDLISTETLKEQLLAVKFNKGELADPIGAAEKLDPIKAQALLYQVSAKEGQLPVIRSETISLALELGKSSGHYFAISHLYADLIAGLDRSIDMLWFSPHAVRALLGAGDIENAKAWYLMLRNAAFTDTEAAKLWTGLRPLAGFAGFDVSADAVAQSLTNWWQAQPEQPETFLKAAKLMAISDGLGLYVPDSLWLKLEEGPKLDQFVSPKTGTWIKMNKAALASQVGEAVLMALYGLGKNDINSLEPAFQRDALFALRTLGLENEARMLAVQAALLGGL